MWKTISFIFKLFTGGILLVSIAFLVLMPTLLFLVIPFILGIIVKGWIEPIPAWYENLGPIANPNNNFYFVCLILFVFIQVALLINLLKEDELKIWDGKGFTKILFFIPVQSVFLSFVSIESLVVGRINFQSIPEILCIFLPTIGYIILMNANRAERIEENLKNLVNENQEKLIAEIEAVAVERDNYKNLFNAFSETNTLLLKERIEYCKPLVKVLNKLIKENEDNSILNFHKENLLNTIEVMKRLIEKNDEIKNYL